MKMTVLLAICVSVALAGAVIFFPTQIGCCRTCIADIRPCLHPEGASHPTANLLNGYVYPYGLLWWGSLLMGVVGIVLLHRRHKGAVKNGSERGRIVAEPQVR